MENSSRKVIKDIAEEAVNTVHRAADELSGGIRKSGNRARGAATTFVGTADGVVIKVRDAVGQEILDKPTFSRSPLAGPRYYLRKIVGADLDRVIHDMRRDGVDLRDASEMNRWLEKKYTPRDADAMDRWLAERDRARGEVTDTDARSADTTRDAPTPPSRATGDRPQATPDPVRDETPPTAPKTERPTAQEILDSPTFSGRSPLAGARYYLREIVGADLDRVVHDMRRDGVDLRNAAAMDSWLAAKYSAPSPNTNTP